PLGFSAGTPGRKALKLSSADHGLLLIQKYCNRALPRPVVSFCNRAYRAGLPLQYWTRKMSFMIRPASISLTSACRSPVESLEVSTRSDVRASRSFICLNWASPGAEEFAFRDFVFLAAAGRVATARRIISA